MKRIFIILFVFFAYKTQAQEFCDLFRENAETVFENSNKDLIIKKYKINNLENPRNGLTVFFAVLNPKYVDFKMIDVKQEGNVEAVYKNNLPKKTLIAVNASFFGYDNNNNYMNLGLLVSNSKVLNPLIQWKQGGVFYKDSKGEFKITHISKFFINAENPIEAVQSRPIVVYKGENDIYSDDGNRRNRTAIGIDKKGNIIIAVVSNSLTSSGISLFEMGELFSKNHSNCGFNVQYLLCMDGGSSSYMAIPNKNLYTGLRNYYFVSSIAAFFLKDP